MVTILPALGQVREDLVALLDRTAVEGACRGGEDDDRRTNLHPNAIINPPPSKKAAPRQTISDVALFFANN